jgi:2-amino-4-hydroxy-6-hydroxymethyldihydropteridine diphosphokinase
MTETVYIGLGSNLGDRQAYLQTGLTELDALPEVQIKKISSLYETLPIGYTDQPDFLNAVCSLTTSLLPMDLLMAMQEIEIHHHRQRTIHWGPRTLDLDLLLYNTCQIASKELTLPHRLMHERCFVLAPLDEIAPHLIHPTTGKHFTTYCRELTCSSQVKEIGTLTINS